MSVKPMLASDASENLEMVKYPVMVSPKLDGIRCLKIDGKAVSRNGKPIPNAFVRDYVEKHAQEGDDGELIIKGAFNEVASGIMSRSGEPDFEFQIFDNFRIDDTYKNRFHNLKVGGRIALVPHVIVKNEKEMMMMEDRWVNEGYEGIMLNDPMGLYKHGRSTLRGGELAKIKRFKDEEAVIVGFEEQMKNTNEAKKDNHGLTERSTSKDGMVPKDTLGALIVKSPAFPGIEFNIGTGFDDATRKLIWIQRQNFLGKTVTFKYQPHGTVEAPRFPVFKCFREDK